MGSEPKVAFESYAFVTAGLCDGLELSELLEYLEIAPRTWEGSEAAWGLALLDDLERGGLLCLRLDPLQQLARSVWRRPIPPLDEDVRAWVDFQHQLGAHPEPASYLEQLGIGAADLGRLAREWGERLQHDPRLAEEMRRVLSEPRRPIDVPPPPRPRLPPRTAPLDGTAFFEAFDVEDEVAGDGLPFVEAEATSAEERSVELPSLFADLPPPPPEDDIRGTALAGSIAWDGTALPFSAPAVSHQAPQLDLLVTGDAIPALQDAALPFAQGDASAVAPPPASERATPASIGETGFVSVEALGLAPLPFGAEQRIDATRVTPCPSCGLTLGQLAALAVELELTGDRAAALASYQLAEARYAVVEEELRAALDDAALRQAFDAAAAAYRAWREGAAR